MDTQSNNTVISQTVSAPKRQMDAVEVTAADYNGESWDSSPFSAIPQWLLDAHASGNIIPVTPASTDYAEWLIKSPDGEKYISPGDTLYEDLRVFEQPYNRAENQSRYEIYLRQQAFRP